MRSLTKIALLASTSLSFVAACSSSDDFTDELAGETSDDIAGDGKADAAVDGSYTYFAIRGDARKCTFPMCGGFYLERLNRSSTKCADGSESAACYVPELDFAEAGLSEALQGELAANARNTPFASQGLKAIVRGRFAPKGLTPETKPLGRFVVTEAWVAQGEPSTDIDGVFVRVKDGGVRCIAAPCESMIEKGLNTSRHAMVAGVDTVEAGLTDDQNSAMIDQFFTPGGVIVVGDRYTIREQGRKARGRTATAVYTRLVDAPASAACFVGGCSGQLCSDQEGAISTCEWREEYACYASATCERQADGGCGWTQTAELTSCLGNTAN